MDDAAHFTNIPVRLGTVSFPCYVSVIDFYIMKRKMLLFIYNFHSALYPMQIHCPIPNQDAECQICRGPEAHEWEPEKKLKGGTMRAVGEPGAA